MADNRPIVILGGDGYLGWPLALSVARRNRFRDVILVDNGLRRKLVSDVGGCSLLPILDPDERVAAYRRIYDLDNMQFIHMDVNTDALDSLIEERRPTAIYHLAQQCSAPYSMRSCAQALFTVRNNEEGNMRLLWAVRRHVPDCHIVKLGSFGEYAKSGIEVAEGYFTPIYNGKSAGRPVPYPREADDFYHASKINDTNYISVACRKWGLSVTDIMQSTLFGSWTPDIDQHEDLFTRLDYDECFGTVVNRFLAQALRGEPLTVYGTGHQRTGLMALNDSVNSLSSLWCQPPDAGTHRVINHLTEESFSINELAETIRQLAAAEGFAVEIQHGVYDPRVETQETKQEYGIERRHVRENLKASALGEVVSRTLQMLLPYRERINTRCFVPTTLWQQDATSDARNAVVVPITSARISEKPPRRADSEAGWEGYRLGHFPYQHLNLNPGTLGTPSQDVLDAMETFRRDERLAQPLEEYRHGRAAMTAALETASSLWHAPEHTIHAAGSASQCSNLLALSLARVAARMRRPLRVLTTRHEHAGGIGAFEKMREFDLSYLSEREMYDLTAFENRVAQLRPDVGFFSHITYDSGHVLPVSEWGALMRHYSGDCLFISDVSQSLGHVAPVFNNIDVVFGSCHKWLFGPRGTGLLWTNERVRDALEGLQWAGESLSHDSDSALFSPAGGMDFAVFAGLDAALQLYRRADADVVHARSVRLAKWFASRASGLLKSYGIAHRFVLPPEGQLGETGILSVSFSRFDPYPLYCSLNEHMIHCKCIKDRDRRSKPRRLLRFGFPYYETENRLQRALRELDACLRENRLIGGLGAGNMRAHQPLTRR